MNSEFFTALELLEKERGIAVDYMLEKIEVALLNAYKKEYEENSNVRIVIDPEKKEVKMYQQKEVVEEVTDPITQISLEEARQRRSRIKVGTILETKMDTKNFRRLSAGKGKQIIIQAIREAEHGQMREEFHNKNQEIVTAKISKVDPQTLDAIVEIGKLTGKLLRCSRV